MLERLAGNDALKAELGTALRKGTFIKTQFVVWFNRMSDTALSSLAERVWGATGQIRS